MIDDRGLATFEEARPALRGLAYRILGSLAEAEDAVQDTFLKWQAANQAEIENPPAWLTTVCTRRCLDLLKAADRARVDYVGTWLPEPLQTASAESPVELAASVTTAFLLLLDRLTPKERAAYLLREIFDQDYAEVAQTLRIQEAACRKLVSRAQAALRREEARRVAPPARQAELLDAFQLAVNSGATERLSALLADDIALSADGGGKATAASRVLRGRKEVLGFITKILGRSWPQWRQVRTEINGVLGLVIMEGDTIHASITFGFDEEGALSNIYIMRNPEKFGGLGADPRDMH
ncbi:RNA polymerase sigma factor SigJ [Pelagibius marinus]|uniref:RNA polymerase sigma factor SigJ n=1 Tax=Pelagibius marinus TaxID=2762760 RepID=UPI0018731980|nr:RNA polymerase sigma factor SigJ [Pelagibius marinus]